jgi:hypothetical protein
MRPLRICYRAWPNWRFRNAQILVRAGRFLSVGERVDRGVHHQPWRLQGRHAIAKIADVLSQKAGAHFCLPASALKMIAVTKRSMNYAKIIKFF